jgi:hypothetical protein
MKIVDANGVVGYMDTGCKFKAGFCNKSRAVPFIILCNFLITLQCSLLGPDHYFPIQKPHSFDPGSSEKDSAVVFEILKMNDIPTEKFASVAIVDKDWRIHSLNLSKMGIDTLPESIGELGALDILDLSNNAIHILPDSIVNLKIIYPEKVCKSFQGRPEYCTTYVRNGLKLNDNFLCDVPEIISNWIDKHFEKNDYIKADTTQRCF